MSRAGGLFGLRHGVALVQGDGGLVPEPFPWRRTDWSAQPERERRAFADGARDGQLPPHEPGQMAANREPEPGAWRALAQAGTGLNERIEDALELIRCDPAARVRNLYICPLADALCYRTWRRPGLRDCATHRNATSPACELDGIREEVDEDLLDPLG